MIGALGRASSFRFSKSPSARARFKTPLVFGTRAESDPTISAATTLAISVLRSVLALFRSRGGLLRFSKQNGGNRKQFLPTRYGFGNAVGNRRGRPGPWLREPSRSEVRVRATDSVGARRDTGSL